ncbi:amino acid adenylation domain-containing protein [Aquimarina rhabdastrellae]
MKLTLPQQDVYFEQLIYPETPIYNIGAKIEIKGDIDIQAFKEAYITLIDQHDAYRMILVENDDKVESRILNKHNAELGFVDFSIKENPEKEVDTYMRQEFVTPFDFHDQKLLHRFTLLKVADDLHYLFSVYHHIITDGWGTSLMFQRLVHNYNEIREFGKVCSTYPYSYTDFVQEDGIYERSEVFESDKKYWLQRFESLPANVFTKKEENQTVIKNKRKELWIERSVYNQLNGLGKKQNSSTFHIILGVLYLYFGRKHQIDDFAIGLPVLNRSKRSYKNTVGLFMGVSPLRIRLDFNASFQELVLTIKEQLRKDYRHQRFPLGKLVKELQLFQEKDRLFNITLSYEKQDYSTNFMGTKTRVLPMTHGTERVAMAIYIREFDEKEDVKIDFDYNLNYFDDQEAETLVNHFEMLIHNVISKPSTKLKDFEYVLKEEKQKFLTWFDSRSWNYHENESNTILDLFVEQVKENPNKVAVRDLEKSYSYLELNEVSSKIASCLEKEIGNHNDAPVAIMMDRSAVLIPILLGVLKLGRPYIPLDPNFPNERLKYILEDSRTMVIIGDSEYYGNISSEITFFDVDDLENKAILSTRSFSASVSPESTAYIIYTSGSTGNPKGVGVRHKSLSNFLNSIVEKPGISEKDILYSVTTMSFDISILEFFAPLVAGATIYIANKNTLSNPEIIYKELVDIEPTIIQATPGFYQMISHVGWKGSKQLKVLCGGDLLSESLANELIKHNKEVWNMYGPTETTIWSGIKKLEKPKDAVIIGEPILETCFYILDAYMYPVPMGIPGTIFIGGEGVAIGYHNKQELTQQKFVKNPYDNNSILYNTGDIGRWNYKGEIEFLGREDHQVKIRGYRVELGDIETKLNNFQEIKESVVLVKKGEQQESFLVAFIQFVSVDKQLSPDHIIQKIRNQLPEYMIPYTILSVESFPMTPNQKVDRKALLNKIANQHYKKVGFVAPSSMIENELEAYWKHILNIDTPISVHDNFFSLGGHSLNAVRLSGVINEKYHFNFSLKTIFDNPTIQSQARYISLGETEASLQTISKATSKEYYPLTPSQYNIWLASQHHTGMSIAYNMPSVYEGRGTLDEEKLEKAIDNIVEKYEVLRTNFVEIRGVPYQKIDNDKKFKLSINKNIQSTTQVKDKINKAIHKEFDLKKDLLFKVFIFQTTQGKTSIVFCTHHIIMDGWSLQIFVRELIQNYKELTLIEDDLSTNSLPIQFKDYSEYLISGIEGNKEKLQSFWKEYLEGYQFKPSFMLDYTIENVRKHDGAMYSYKWSREITKKLKTICIDREFTLHTFLVASLKLLIHKMSDHEDICLGTLNSGRNNITTAHQIGMFVKTVPLRTIIDPDVSFASFTKILHKELTKLDKYQDVPLNTLKYNYFDILLTYQNPDFSLQDSIELGDSSLIYNHTDIKYSRIPLLFDFSEYQNQLKAEITYNSEMYTKETIILISSKFDKVLESAIKEFDMVIKDIDVSLKEEKVNSIDFNFNF